MSVDAYVFDAYGTLFDVHSAINRHAAAIGSRSDALSALWRQKQLEYTWVRALAGRYRDFAALTEEALDFALATVAPEHAALKPALLAAYRRLDPYPEVHAVLAGLQASGKRIAVLSNGTPSMLAENIASAGVGQFIEATFSVDALRTYKTAPEVYAFACSQLKLAPAAISFQSSNRWDIAGAVAAGLRAVWINRRGQPDEYRDLPPVATIATLDGLRRLAEQPSPNGL
jgi:2-haloacid dehalogenase